MSNLLLSHYFYQQINSTQTWFFPDWIRMNQMNETIEINRSVTTVKFIDSTNILSKVFMISISFDNKVFVISDHFLTFVFEHDIWTTMTITLKRSRLNRRMYIRKVWSPKNSIINLSKLKSKTIGKLFMIVTVRGRVVD